MSKQVSEAKDKSTTSRPDASAERPTVASSTVDSGASGRGGVGVAQGNAREVGVPRPSSLEGKTSGTTANERDTSGLATSQGQASGASANSPLAVQVAASDSIRKANRELTERTADQLALALVVLAEQRDAALTRLASSAHEAQRARDSLVAEHDQFVAYLMEEQDAKVEALEKQLVVAKQGLERQRALAPAGNGSRVDDEEREADLRRLLQTAYEELGEANRVVAQLEQERDEALRAADDVRVELYSQLETTRDESIGLQAQLDEMHRQLEDARDRARDEAIELTAQVEVAQRELDERRAEVANLRQRLETLTEEVKHSQPPPPMVSDELSKARQETQTLRRELIESKRQLSRVTRDYEILRTLRARATQAGAQSAPVEVAPGTPDDTSGEVGQPELAHAPQVPFVQAHVAAETPLVQDLPPQANAGQWPAVKSSVPPPLPANAFAHTLGAQRSSEVAAETAEQSGVTPQLEVTEQPTTMPRPSGWPPAIVSAVVAPSPTASGASMSDAAHSDPAASSNNLG